jgi:hypothetical protein
MKRLGIAAALLVMASTTYAQGGTVDPQCTGNSADACQKTIDLFRYLAPQLGTAIAGGNTIMGQGGSMGGLPHWTAGIRVNLVSGSIPEFTAANAPTVGAAASSAYTTSTKPLPFAAVDGAIGVFGGLPLGLTKIGGIDLLVNAAYVPSVSTDNVSIVPDKSTQFGGGIRIGLLQESLIVPGVAVSMIRRGLPTTTINTFTTFGSSNGTPDTLQMKDLDLKTTSYRLTVSKSLILFGVAAGVGMDKYSTSTTVNTAIHRNLGVLLNQRVAGSFTAKSEVTRTNAFADLYLNLLLLKIVGEVGVASGGSVNTFNTFDKSPNAARPYGAVGLRVGF